MFLSSRVGHKVRWSSMKISLQNFYLIFEILYITIKLGNQNSFRTSMTNLKSSLYTATHMVLFHYIVTQLSCGDGNGIFRMEVEYNGGQKAWLLTAFLPGVTLFGWHSMQHFSYMLLFFKALTQYKRRVKNKEKSNHDYLWV